MTEPYNAAERPHVKAAAKIAKQAEADAREFIVSSMSTRQGRLWMLAKLEACHIFQSSFHTEPTSMAFAEGERNIGLQILGDIMANCPDQFIQMMREKNERNTSTGAGRDTPREPDSTGGTEPDTTEGWDNVIDPAELRALDEAARTEGRRQANGAESPSDRRA